MKEPIEIVTEYACHHQTVLAITLLVIRLMLGYCGIGMEMAKLIIPQTQRSRMVCIEETTILFTSASKSIISKEGYPVWS